MLRRAGQPLSVDFGVLLVAQFLIQALTALTGILIARTLEPVQYAAYTLAVTGLNVTLIITDFGMSQLIARDGAALDKMAALTLWRRALRLRLTFSLVGYLAMIGLTFWLSAIGQPDLAAIAGLALFPLTVAALTTGLLNAQQVMKRGAGVNALAALANTALTLTALFIWRDVAILLAVNILTSSFAAFLLWRTARRHFLLSPRPFGERVRVRGENSSNLHHIEEEGEPTYPQLLKIGASFLGINLASIVFQYADIYVVAWLVSDKELGWYSAALRLLGLMTVIATVWGIAALPRFSRLRFNFQSGELPDARQAEKRMARNWQLILSGTGVGLAVLALPLSELVVHWLLSEKYAMAATPLAILCWNGAAIFAGTVAVTRLVAAKKQKEIGLVLTVGGLLSLGCTILFTGAFGWGINGAAAAKVIGGWVLALGYFFFQRRI